MADDIRDAIRQELDKRNVSENDLRLVLRAELGDLELRLMDKLVSRAEHIELVKRTDALASAVAEMTIHGSARAREDHQELESIQEQILINISWRNKMAGAIATLTVFASVAAPVVIHHYF